MNIKISIDFSTTPGGRFIHEGEYSGEKFRIELLSPQYKEALEKGEKLIIDFDGCYGYATSFLEEAFGGLVRERKEKGTLDHIELISEDDVTIPDLIREYVLKQEALL